MLTEYSTKDSIIEINEKVISDVSFGENIRSYPNPKTSIVIENQKFTSILDLRGIWSYRELLYFLALRDIKIRYKQTLLGIAWVLLQPIITTVIFTTIFLKLGTAQNLDVPYPLFAFSGFTLWTFINAAINNCSNSLVNHSTLVTKVYFPRLIIPLSAVAATLVDLLFGLVSLIIAMFIYGVFPKWQILLIPFLIIPAVFLSLGIGIFTASLNVKYRDVKYILPFILQVFLFISPVFYALSMLSEDSVWIWQFNPLTGILENFRALLFGLNFDWYSFGISTGISLLTFFGAVYVFYRMEDDFADVI
jgi:lipopolysaccharide transport system permease protein